MSSRPLKTIFEKDNINIQTRENNRGIRFLRISDGVDFVYISEDDLSETLKEYVDYWSEK